MLEHLGHRETDVFGDLPEKNRRNVAAGVERNRCTATRAITKLFVRTTLPHFGKSQFAQDRYDFRRLENRDVTHSSGDGNVLHPDELRFENWLAVLEQHRNDLTKVCVQLIQRGALRMRPGKPGNKSHEQTGIWISLDYRRIGFHKEAPSGE